MNYRGMKSLIVVALTTYNIDRLFLALLRFLLWSTFVKGKVSEEAPLMVL